MLFYIKHKPFEVFPFGVVDVDGMVGRLGELVEDAYAATALGGCREYGQTELFAAHGLRAGEGEQDSPLGNLLECLCVEALIAAQGVAQGAPVLGECRRVEHD